MTIYITSINFSNHHRPSLFILTRPFYDESGWVNDDKVKIRWKVSNDFWYTSNLEEADVLFIPNPINGYSAKELHNFNTMCVSRNIKGYGYISGDYGKQYPEFSNLVYYRMGGFQTQLSDKNRGFPVSISDYYGDKPVIWREKQKLPMIGFCGHAQLSYWKAAKEQLVFIKENALRFLTKPFRKDYEPLFSSGFQRAKLLNIFEKSSLVQTNFICRKHYRAGAITPLEREKTTQEYFENIKNSDYVLCVRGGGNFSVRLYETLMMGRIPVFVNTDCLFPFETQIDWKAHVVWVEWNNRHQIAKLVSEFHNNLSDKAFMELQQANRLLWKETLSVNNMLKLLKSDITND